MNFFSFSIVTIILTLCGTPDLVGQSNDNVYFMVEETAEFPGGNGEFIRYISETLKYPRKAKKNGVGGKVFVEFFINKDGSVDQDSIRVLSREEVVINKGAEIANEVTDDKSLVDEAIRIMRQCPKWIPGTQRGKPVRQKIVFPLNFRAY